MEGVYRVPVFTNEHDANLANSFDQARQELADAKAENKAKCEEILQKCEKMLPSTKKEAEFRPLCRKKKKALKNSQKPILPSMK